MRIAIVGCGFVADYYLATLKLHPELILQGVFDQIPERSAKLSIVYGVHRYSSLTELLADQQVQMVLNLTNPREHYEISRLALLAEKHVYSEKPLAMELAQAAELVALAAERGLMIGGAPCSMLGETAQTIWKSLRENIIGTVRLVYAEMDDGLIHLMQYRKWQSVSGVPWPYKDEFEVGCTLEHAGYYLTWLTQMFGPAQAITSFSAVQIPEKIPGEVLNLVSPDFTVACIQFAGGVVVRLTCGIIAPHDHCLKIIGDKGVLCTDEAWDYRASVYKRRMLTIRRKTLLSPWRERIRLPAAPFGKPQTKGAQSMDFARGPAEMANAFAERRPCRISPAFTLHVTEMALAIHHAARDGAFYRMTTSFSPIEPMPWAR